MVRLQTEEVQQLTEEGAYREAHPPVDVVDEDNPLAVARVGNDLALGGEPRLRHCVGAEGAHAPDHLQIPRRHNRQKKKKK